MPRGGKRLGAGRPRQYSSPSKVVRLPANEIARIKRYLTDNTAAQIPLFSSKVAAGHPAMADDHIDEYINLNELIKNPHTTFAVRVSGESMIEAGIHENDLLLVDKNLEPTDGKIVIAALGGQLTVKKIYKVSKQLFLMPANPKFSPIEVKEEDNIHIWGVVTKVIHDLK